MRHFDQLNGIRALAKPNSKHFADTMASIGSLWRLRHVYLSPRLCHAKQALETSVLFAQLLWQWKWWENTRNFLLLHLSRLSHRLSLRRTSTGASRSSLICKLPAHSGRVKLNLKSALMSPACTIEQRFPSGPEFNYQLLSIFYFLFPTLFPLERLLWILMSCDLRLSHCRTLG